jgi:hypothetical protein
MKVLCLSENKCIMRSEYETREIIMKTEEVQLYTDEVFG